MKSLLRVLLFACSVGSLAAAAKTQEENVFIFENRKVSIAVPAGLGFASEKDDAGLISVQLADKKNSINAHIVFVEDPENHFAAERVRKEKMVDLFEEYVARSVEKAMQFEELQPKSGAGTYCMFTDAELVGKATLPAGEFRHFTTGIKAWPGVVAVFRVYANDTDSKDYKAVMAMLRDSVEEKPVPLR